MFYGSGAGKLPTASAVVADVVDEARHLNRSIMAFWSSKKLELTDISNSSRKFFVRVKGTPESKSRKFWRSARHDPRSPCRRLRKRMIKFIKRELLLWQMIYLPGNSSLNFQISPTSSR